VLVFTAEEAWLARFPGEHESVHLHDFPTVPEAWRDDGMLVGKWTQVRRLRSLVTTEIERLRRAGIVKSSLEAAATLRLGPEDFEMLDDEAWSEVCICRVARQQDADHEQRAAQLANPPKEVGFISDMEDILPAVSVTRAPGTKCDRCWRVLEEVGKASPAHPTLCRRCTAVVTGVPESHHAES